MEQAIVVPLEWMCVMRSLNPSVKPSRRTPGNTGADVVFDAAFKAVTKHITSFLELAGAEHYLMQLCFGGNTDEFSIKLMNQMSPRVLKLVQDRFATTCTFKRDKFPGLILPGMGMSWFKEGRSYAEAVISGVQPPTAKVTMTPINTPEVVTTVAVTKLVPYDYGSDVFNRTVAALAKSMGDDVSDRKFVTDFVGELCFVQNKTQRGNSLSNWLSESEKKRIMFYFKTSCHYALHEGVTLPGMEHPDFESTVLYAKAG